MVKCIGCGDEIPEGTGFMLQGMGMICNVSYCYAEFNAKREKLLAKLCYGDE